MARATCKKQREELGWRVKGMKTTTTNTNCKLVIHLIDGLERSWTGQGQQEEDRGGGQRQQLSLVHPKSQH